MQKCMPTPRSIIGRKFSPMFLSSQNIEGAAAFPQSVLLKTASYEIVMVK